MADFNIGSCNWPGLSKLIEECGEVLQVAGKLMGTGGEVAHWDGSDLRDKLHEELSDMIAAAGFFAEVNSLDAERLRKRSTDKVELFRKWHIDNGGVLP